MNRILKSLREYGMRLRQSGVRHTCQLVASRIQDRWFERKLGISATGHIPIDILFESGTGNCNGYAPTSFTAFKRALQSVPICKGRDVFLDYGSGKGRVVIMAALYPFLRVIGVEISKELTACAQENVELCRKHLLCPTIELKVDNAAEYEIPPDVTVVWLYNPFHGHVLRAVLDRLRQSLKLHPRRLSIVYNNSIEFVKNAHEYRWLIERKEFVSGGTLCTIYEADCTRLTD